MADYIEREKVAELIDYHQEEYCEAESYFGLLKEDFQQLPSADVAPVVRGKWENHGMVCGLEKCNCSLCGWHSFKRTNFCPNCGAKMDLLN